MTAPAANSTRRVLLASLAGTTIEFFDFYIYGTAAVLVFPTRFFPASDPTAATLQSLATFSIAFFARPVGAAVFGHFGDRVGRKATLVAALLTTGIATVIVGVLPTYASIGMAAPLLLALCRFGQGFGLGGEWGGAVLLATENAPPGKRAWYGMFPQLGAPIGFFLSAGIFYFLSKFLSNAAFLDYGWRIPFICSSGLVVFGLYVRLKIAETPLFERIVARAERQSVPFLTVCRHHAGAVVLGTATALATFATFYLVTVFCLSWGTHSLGYGREPLLLCQLAGVVALAATIPASAHLADRHGRRKVLLWVALATAGFGIVLGPLFEAGLFGALLTMVFGLGLMGMSYGPLSALLSELFPTSVRYSGSSISYNFAGLFGGSLVPFAATWLAAHHGLRAVGYCLGGTALVSLAALGLSRETRGVDLAGDSKL